jgi:hypothetical protein
VFLFRVVLVPGKWWRKCHESRPIPRMVVLRGVGIVDMGIGLDWDTKENGI